MDLLYLSSGLVTKRSRSTLGLLVNLCLELMKEAKEDSELA